MPFQSLRGTADLLPDDVTRWLRIEHLARRVSARYGYQELRTPLIEDAALFLRSIGETTDIIQKEMFRFEDRGGHDIVLRPEGTASIVRAYLEHHLDKTQGFAKLFYLGPMFRAERPQAGRFRQFHQYGVEAIGSASPWVDVEVMVLCVHILRECGLADASVWLSSMGCRHDQERSAARLRERLSSQKSALCKECQARFEKNVFRVLDCKHPSCQAIARTIQGSPFLLCADCVAHFEEVRRGLREARIAFDDTKVFARGLDYYTRTVFEVRAQGLGAQDAVAAGGRYDRLVEEFGGPSVGAVGFAAGIERILMAIAQSPQERHADGGSQPMSARRGVYLAIAQPALLGPGFALIQALRQHGVQAIMDYDSKSLKAQLREADKATCRFVAILGDTELKAGVVTVKDLEQGAQQTVARDAFIDHVSQQAKTICH